MSDTTYEGKTLNVDTVDYKEASEENEIFPGFPYFLFTEDEVWSAKSSDMLKCKCKCCNKEFLRSRGEIVKRIKANKPNVYCSLACTNQSNNIKIKQNAERRKQKRLNAKPDYVCECCGKYVLGCDTYGSGRFCSAKCSHTHVAVNYANTPEKRKQKSDTLSGNGKKKLKEVKKRKSKLNEEKIIYQQILNLYHLYNLKEMNNILRVNVQLFRRIIRKYNIQPNPTFLPVQQFGRIKYTKLILNIQNRSITYKDFIRAKLILEHYYYNEMMSSKEIKELYNIKHSGFDMCLKSVFGINLRNLSQSIRNYHQNLGTYDNKTEKEIYYMQCAFRFPRSEYSRIPGFELVKQYGWYKPTKNRFFGATRDHMVSRHYGWTHKIDPEIIRHPANCQIMLSTDNSSKGEKCTITLEELLDRIKHWEK